jgi:glutamate formiminotransferase
MNLSKIIESVPNISEARREDVLQEILGEIKGIPDTRVLDVKPDLDHNRTVVSLAGSPSGLKQLLLRLYEVCVKIDLANIKANTPGRRCSVTPFIPIKNSSMEECAELARELWRKQQRNFKFQFTFTNL